MSATRRSAPVWRPAGLVLTIVPPPPLLYDFDPVLAWHHWGRTPMGSYILCTSADALRAELRKQPGSRRGRGVLLLPESAGANRGVGHMKGIRF